MTSRGLYAAHIVASQSAAMATLYAASARAETQAADTPSVESCRDTSLPAGDLRVTGLAHRPVSEEQISNTKQTCQLRHTFPLVIYNQHDWCTLARAMSTKPPARLNLWTKKLQAQVQDEKHILLTITIPEFFVNLSVTHSSFYPIFHV
jgi:hypothetical protein